MTERYNQAEGLKPCPFCDGRGIPAQDYEKTSWAIRCFGCWAAGPVMPDMARAVKAWNDRPRERKAAAVVAQATVGGGR